MHSTSVAPGTPIPLDPRHPNVEALDDLLTRPTPALIADLDALDGDIMVIGSAGKMGPTLSVLAQRALDEAGRAHRVIAVSRFSDEAAKARLDAAGVTTIPADLSAPQALADLPDAPNVVYMLGTKFGTTGREYQTWATNVAVSAQVASRFRESRITVFSSGNIYPLRPVVLGGADETVAPEPVGEYAQTCLGRERVFEHAAHQILRVQRQLHVERHPRVLSALEPTVGLPMLAQEAQQHLGAARAHRRRGRQP